MQCMRSWWVMGAALPLLAGCVPDVPESTADLPQWMQESARGMKGRIEPLPTVKRFAVWTYAAYELADPFDVARLVPPRAMVADADPGLPAPDQQRPREPLEAFALDELQVKGVIERDGTRFVLIVAPDGRLYRIAPGSRLGQDFGELQRIEVRREEGRSVVVLTLRELVQDSEGKWRERVREWSGQSKKG